MTGFAADWLALRREVDRQSRNPEIEEAFLSFLAADRENEAPLRLIDLASGTGANLAVLRDKLPKPQHWTLMDHDQALLEEIQPPPEANVQVTCQLADLSDPSSFNHFSKADGLVTTAFLDLVSRSWMTQLVKAITAARLPFLATLSYNGTVTFAPQHRHDAVLIEAVNMHQRTDKGFGLALGPTAADTCAALFKQYGYDVQTAPSDWVLTGQHGALLRDLVRGWSGAAVEMGIPTQLAEDWKRERISLSQSADCKVVVGHTDLVALPRP
ncbi:SAM-dependent methyltransferase [Pseudovibrio exalbescens]|uniref:SAM-dependent methyltransferase n=1 Tax=Pseudovibrio exalbescens TaxID=197461 RepID=UPI000C9B5329|nr:SAM-dependent methyltransferase [Pseudovibrio exalbescens]